MTITNENDETAALGLGPMAVAPAYQRQGIGSALARAGLAACSDQGFEIVIVLGHPGFYPRFGFRISEPFGIKWEHEVPAEVFMVAELVPEALQNVRGVVRYQPEFNEV